MLIRKMIREHIKKIIQEEESAAINYSSNDEDSSNVEELEGGGGRLGTVTFEGVPTGPWKQARYYRDITVESKDELWKMESPIPYIYDDLRPYIGKRTFISMFSNDQIENLEAVDPESDEAIEGVSDAAAAAELWNYSPKIKKVRNRFGQTIPYPAESFAECVGTPTIGVGHALQTQEEFEDYDIYNLFEICKKENIMANTQISLDGMLMTDEEMKELFYKDLIIHMQFKERITEPITQSMFDALTSLAFNSGWEAKHPVKGYTQPIEHIIRLINKKKYKSAKKLLSTIATTSNGVPLEGLVKRREFESELFGRDGLSPKLSDQNAIAKKEKTSSGSLAAGK